MIEVNTPLAHSSAVSLARANRSSQVGISICSVDDAGIALGVVTLYDLGGKVCWMYCCGRKKGYWITRALVKAVLSMLTSFDVDTVLIDVNVSHREALEAAKRVGFTEFAQISDIILLKLDKVSLERYIRR